MSPISTSLVVSALTLFVAGTAALAAPRAPKNQVILCTGAFARDASHESVVRAFGAKNVVYRRIHLPDDDEGLKGTVVFSSRPARQIEILWSDQKGRRKPHLVTFGPAWRTSEGIRIGQTLEEIEAINRGPFVLSGFDWDYGGTATEWKGGALEKQKGGCRLVVRFGIGDDAPNEPALKVSGDKDFSSRDPNMRAVKPAVREIAIMYE